MSEASEPICFYCGQAFQVGSQLNRMSDGRSCPICSDRLMQSLPSLLPSGGGARGEQVDQVQDGEADAGAGAEQEQDEERSAPVYLRAVQDRPEPA